MATSESNIYLPKSKIPEIEEFELTNGLKGLFIDIADCSSMTVDLSFQAGTYFAPASKPELAHFLEHLVLGANKDYPSKAATSEAFQRLGGYHNGFTDGHHICYRYDTPDFDWRRLFQLLLTTVSQPLFLPSEFDLEKQVVQQELTIISDDKDQVFSWDKCVKMDYALQSLSKRIDTLQNITLKDITNYYRKTHGTANARLIVAGTLPTSRRNWIKQQLQSLQLPASNAIWQTGIPPEKLQSLGIFHRINSNRQGIYYDFSFVNNQHTLQISEFDALTIIDNLFYCGVEARIFGQLRSQGLAYNGYFYKLETYSSAGCGFAGETTEDNLEQIIDIILDEIDCLLMGGIKVSELEASKNKILGSYLLDTFTSSYWLDRYRDSWLCHDLIISADYPQRLKMISPELITDLVRQLLKTKQWTLALHGVVSPSLKRRLKSKLEDWATSLESN